MPSLMGLVRRLGSSALRLAERALARQVAVTFSKPRAGRSRTDERTIRETATKQAGGISTEASVKSYQSGENPGGLHHAAPRDVSNQSEGLAEFVEEELEHGERHRHGVAPGMSETRRGT
jgi:hypothetical protein